jgi:hypothetical protein
MVLVESVVISQQLGTVVEHSDVERIDNRLPRAVEAYDVTRINVSDQRRGLRHAGAQPGKNA